MAGGSLVSGKVLASFSLVISLLTILFFKQYDYPILAIVYYNVKLSNIANINNGVLANLGYSLGFISPVYAALTLVLLWGNRQTSIYAFYYYKKYYLFKIVGYALSYSLGFVTLMLVYLVSALGEVWNSILIIISFMIDFIFFLIIYSILNLRLNYFLSLSIFFILMRFFVIPEKSLWASSIPLAATYTIMHQVGIINFIILVVLYYLVAIIIYWKGARE